MASKLYDYTPAELQKILDESTSYADVLRKLQMSEHGSNYITLRKIIQEYNLDLQRISENRANENLKFVKQLHNTHSKTLDEILVKNSTYNHGNNLKKKLFQNKIKEEKCESCGLIEWQGQKIPLQLHHKDGDHHNNEIENLEILCPNCHALTDTYAGKNVKRKGKIIQPKTRIAKTGISEDGQRLYDGYGNYKILCPECKKNFMNKEATICKSCYKQQKIHPKVDKEYLMQLINEYHNYTKIGQILGVDRESVSKWHRYYVKEDINNGIIMIASENAPSREVLKTKIRTMSFVQIGKEYNVTDKSVSRWCFTYGLPSRARDIKSISDEDWETI